MPDIFKRSVTNKSISITFSSTLENIDRICQEVMRFLHGGFKDMEKHFFAINLVIREGLTNAVRHGNELNPHKNVKFFLRIDQNTGIRMIIEDQGDGFDWKKIKELYPADADEHGRGLGIMASYFSSCGYNKKGNRLILEKKLPS